MKKKLFAICLVLIAMVGITVNAKTDNGFYADDSVSVKKNINTTSFVAGNNVDMSSTVDGLNFVAGNYINLSSTQDYIFVAGNVITMNNVNAKDAFVAGSIIRVNQSSIRDLYVAGETITIDSDITRNVYAGGNKITINSVIDGNVKLAAEEVEIGSNAVINGNLSYNEDANVVVSKDALIAKTTTYKSSSNENLKVEMSPVAVVIDEITTRLMSFLSILVISLLLLALNKKVFKEISKIGKDSSTVVKTAVMGFAFLCGLPVAAIILLITVIGIPISIISLLLYGILIYLSVTATAYYISNFFQKGKIKNEYLQFTISLLIIYILKLIPIIGGLVSFISLCLGLGIYVTLFNKYLKSNK